VNESLLCALIGHLVGDYLLQNDWMALNKKKSSFHCGVHCLIWATSVVLFAGWGWLPWLVLLAVHFGQDRTNVIGWWMKTVGQEKFASGPCSPWSIIVVDNVWHVVQIWAVAKWLA
jgi:Protein of unknown function (DUF3307)